MSQESLATIVGRRARETPDRLAYVVPSSEPTTWAQYDASSSALAGLLIELGLAPGERFAVLLPDGAGVHAAFVGIEKAGLVTVAIGPRAGLVEIEHVLRRSGASGLISSARHQEHDMASVVDGVRASGVELRHHIVVDETKFGRDASAALVDGAPVSLARGAEAEIERRKLSADEPFLLNSTSGTTGLPKVVIHDQRRWFAFHELAVPAGALSSSDVFMSVVPAPYGFGIWTSHVTPTLLGVPTVVAKHFSADETIAMIERERVSVLAAVTTQFILMLASPALARADLSSLRVLFTGGEAVPYERSAEFEDRTGATVLQFYGSNETGAVSGTTLADSRERRLRTAGRAIAAMNVRLFDEQGRDVTASGRGQPGCKGPTLSRGYFGDPEANAKLVRPDGWVMLGDVVEIDADGYLSVVGRTDDIIIRGGKNVSAVAVEEAIAGHPAVALVAAVAMPDETFGERVCAYVTLRDGCALTLEELVAAMAARGISKETLPERLVVVDDLPRGSGGKIAKRELRADIRQRLAEERGEAVTER